MCEAGAWRSYDELEEVLTLDELFSLYETTAERQKRMIETVASAMGATTGTTGGSSSGGDRMNYEQGEIVGEGGTLFGYRQG